jgi:hypothetical protein
MAKDKDDVISIVELRRGVSTFHILGVTPLLMNRFSEKAKQQLLNPPPRKNAAERAMTLKHDPVAEYRASVYLNRDAGRPARIHAPSEWFKSALANAALDIPGAAKAKIERLVQCSPQIDFYGLPRLHFGMVRSADMNKTPDVRCRAIFPEWACKFDVSFISSLIKAESIANLVAASGEIVGCGDWRPQKGGIYGQFQIVDPNNEVFVRIVRDQGARPQIDALENPVAYDAETEELLAWFKQAVKGRDVAVTGMNDDEAEAIAAE